MLNVVSKDDAVRCVRGFAQTLPAAAETVELSCAYGRTLAEDVVAAEDVPAFDRSTVDGYAVCAADTFGASASVPAQLEIVGEIAMGRSPAFTLRRGQCAVIPTGGMLPQGADAAVMVEHTDEEDGLCLAYKAAAPGENVTRRGDDIAAGTAVLQKGTRLHAGHIGVLAALGKYTVSVYKRPVIAILSTGDELVRDAPAMGQVRDVNGDLLAALVTASGCTPLFAGVVRDERGAVRDALASCLARADAVLISGGSSAGTRDMTVSVLGELGEVFFHGVAMKPGKPTIFGAADGKPVFGLPGHPLAAYFVFRLIVSAYVSALLHLPPDKPVRTARLAVNVPSNHGREEYLCVQIGQDGEIVPLHTKSGVISVLSAADGFIRIPRDTEGFDRGTTVEVYGL
ncbi:MAG: molybdopterin molybdenumtransferase MoeA [Clostridia bacterium]|nr:molybdopterin molybdenumtransferase MoeA [Clostridia bacterium]